ncbi:MAG: S41 family peptidase [Ndongobacter sp.]|nr:S41 family peptidase [Ndongobacter sp.]
MKSSHSRRPAPTQHARRRTHTSSSEKKQAGASRRAAQTPASAKKKTVSGRRSLAAAARPEQTRRRVDASRPDQTLQQRIEASRRRQEQKRKAKDILRRRRRHRRILVFLCLACSLTAAVFAWRWIRRNVLSDTLTSIPHIREEANTAIGTHLLVSDTAGRELTSAERQSDVDLLRRTIEQTVPKINAPGLAADTYEADAAALAEKAIQASTDLDFYNALQELVALLGDSASRVLSPVEYYSLKSSVGQGYFEADSPYAHILSTARTTDRYRRLLTALPFTAPSSEKKKEASSEQKTAQALAPSGLPAALEEHIAPSSPYLNYYHNGNIAVLSGLDFRDSCVGAHRDTLKELAQQAAASSVLVIDLRGKAGLSDLYWSEDLVPLFAPIDVGVSSTIYFKGGFDSFVDHLSTQEKLTEFDLQDTREAVSMLLPQQLQSDLAEMTYGKKMTFSVPKNPGAAPFTGSVILLVDSQTGGSCETFASFCAQSKLCTIAGQPTAGTGWNLPPFLLELPHSGYVVALRTGVAIDPASSSLQKAAGVVPDTVLNGADLLSELLATLP